MNNNEIDNMAIGMTEAIEGPVKATLNLKGENIHFGVNLGYRHCGASLHDEMKAEIAARLVHNLSLDQMEKLEESVKQRCKSLNQIYLTF